jgi:hypothetical protein
VGADELGHQRGNGVGIDRLAPSGREDVAVFDPAPEVARSELFGGLVGFVLAEDGDCFVIDRDDAGTATLGRPVDASPAITAVDPVMVLRFAARSMSAQRRLSSSP